jgi:hypothetical protein
MVKMRQSHDYYVVPVAFRKYHEISGLNFLVPALRACRCRFCSAFGCLKKRKKCGAERWHEVTMNGVCISTQDFQTLSAKLANNTLNGVTYYRNRATYFCPS